MFYLGLTLLLYAVLAWQPVLPRAPSFLVCYALAGVGYWLIYRACRRGQLTTSQLLVAALVVRLFFLPQPPGLSEDIYRYLWDGGLGLRGIHPYLYPPQELPHLEPELFERLAHREMRSIYPPWAQLFFLLSVFLFAFSTTGWKFLLLIAETGMWACLFRLSGGRCDRMALWLFHPLVIVEFYSSGHLDILALAFLAGALFFLGSPHSGRRVVISAACLGVATGVKLFPGLLLPFFLLVLPRGRDRILFLLSFLLTLAAGLLPWLHWGHLQEGLRSYWDAWQIFRSRWRFNSLPFWIWAAYRRELQVLAEVLFVSLYLFFLGGRGVGRTTLAEQSYLVFLLLYSVSPTLHPWYFSWVLLLYPLLGLRYWAGLYVSLASGASYLFYWFSPPGERLWLLLLLHIPFYLLFFRDLWAYHDLPCSAERGSSGSAWKGG